MDSSSKGKTFDGLRDFGLGNTYQDMSFEKCHFLGCLLILQKKDLTLRSHVKQMQFFNCRETGCDATGAIVEDVLIDGLRTSGLLQTWATVFRHVTLKGKIDRVMLSPFIHPAEYDSPFQKIIHQANLDYYAEVDWAIDISAAEFKDFDCPGIPSRLVRRDPETQVMVTRERVIASGDAINAGGEYWRRWLQLFLQDGWYSDGILVAPKRDRDFKAMCDGLNELRRFGVAEPD